MPRRAGGRRRRRPTCRLGSPSLHLRGPSSVDPAGLGSQTSIRESGWSRPAGITSATDTIFVVPIAAAEEKPWALAVGTASRQAAVLVYQLGSYDARYRGRWVTSPPPPRAMGVRAPGSCSRGVALPCGGGMTSPVSSTSRRRTTCRGAGRAGPVSAPPARLARSPGRCPTIRRRSTFPRRAICSSAALRRPSTSSSTSGSVPRRGNSTAATSGRGCGIGDSSVDLTVQIALSAVASRRDDRR